MAFTLPCHNSDPELFFAESSEEIELAKSLCGACPVRSQCLQAALSREEPCGIWGGELFENGKVIARKRTVGRPRLIPAAQNEVGQNEAALGEVTLGDEAESDAA
ncbi:MAG: WhiB family transcriptional regulator [Actinobacteria bacterium]|nr:WhiB family transcriptional regulator [Actinomycetota bacterium]